MKAHLIIKNAAWKVSKYGVFSGLYFPVFSPNTRKCGPEDTLYLDTFHAVKVACAKNNCLIRTITLVIICLLLLVAIVLAVIFIMQNINQNKKNYYIFTTPALN